MFSKGFWIRRFNRSASFRPQLYAASGYYL
jgi:hypothetical protein